MADIYVAAGGNIEPERYLSRALALLAREFVDLRVSPAYRNPAVGFDGADFINLVVAFRSDLPPAEIRDRLQRIEAACDRPAHAPRWAPRTMDLDILLYGDLVSDTPGLLFPRPDLLKRAYMLKPMVDLAPDLLHPTARRTMSELWRELTASLQHDLTPVTIPRCDHHPPPESAQ